MSPSSLETAKISQEFKPEDFKDPKIIENLVKSGRAPFGFNKYRSGPLKSPGPVQRGMFIYIPPKGTKPGEAARSFAGEAYAYVSPDGKMEWADLYRIPLQLGEEIRQKVMELTSLAPTPSKAGEK